MTRSRTGRLSSFVASGAILAFTLLLVFALLRLFETEREMRNSVDDNMLWAVSQGQVAALLLEREVLERIGSAPERAAIERRYNVLLSRLALLSEGPQARYLEGLGRLESVSARYADILTLEPTILNLAPDDHRGAETIRSILSPLADELGRAANETMVTQWNATGESLDAQHGALVQAIVSIVAILALGTFISVTMLRALQSDQRARRSLAREQEISEAYRSFVALVSHQFRTPLAVIDTSMQRLVRRPGAIGQDEIRDRARKTRIAIARLTQLVDTTIDAMRLDAEEVEPSYSDVELLPLLERVKADQREAQPGRDILISVAAAVPPRIVTDRVLVEQILTNLVSNALKYSPERETVSIRADIDPGTLVLAVEDRGIGIPDDEQDRVFHRFFRASTAVGKPGSGIGLNVSRRIATMVGGELDFRSRPGIGSTFTLRLPMEMDHVGEHCSRARATEPASTHG